MDEKDRRTLLKICEHAKDIVSETSDMKSAAEFSTRNDAKTALFDLLQIGELVGLLSKETLSTVTSIPWNQIRGLRNRIVHGYASVDYVTIWETITEDIPLLIRNIENLL